MKTADKLDVIHLLAMEAANINFELDEATIDLRDLLNEYEDVFQESKSLRPERSHDHRILLKPGASPISVCPYRYLFFQKNEIERHVKDLISSGLVRPSKSLYSSPILLVKKTDGA